MMPLWVAVMFVVCIGITTLILGVDEMKPIMPVLINALAIALVIGIIYHFSTRKENKLVEITDNRLIFHYGKEQESHPYEDYDGYMIVYTKSKYGVFTYLYLVKNHKRIEVINPNLYKNRESFRTELDKHLKFLGNKEVSMFTHWFGGGKIDY